MTIKECVNCPGATDHSTAKCQMVRVPRKLLEFIVANARGVEREQMDKLRALLTEQSQASAAPPEGRECPRYVCRKCKQETRPPEPYKAYVLCDCGYMTSATTALSAVLAQPAAQEIKP